jgi:sugar (pentulose or hexulose) kinase
MAYAVAAGHGAIVASGASPAAPLTTLGGGSRDAAYVALLADALGIALRPSTVADATVVGAARLGSAAVGGSMASVEISAHGIVEPTGSRLIAERQEAWRFAVDRDRGSRGI